MSGIPTKELQDAFVAAARDGKCHAKEQALAQGAQVNQPNSGGGYALPQAALHGDIATVETLLAAGASPSIYRVKPALSEAATRGHLGVASMLVRVGAKVDAQGDNGQTALHWAVAYNQTEIVEFLLLQGANVGLIDEHGNTPIDIATELRWTRLLDLLKIHESPEAATERAARSEAKKSDIDEDKVRALPIWIATGFTARCARRAFEHFDQAAQHLPWSCRRDVFRAWHLAERFAVQGRVPPNYSPCAVGDLAIDAYQQAQRLNSNPAIINCGEAAAAAAYVADIASLIATNYPGNWRNSLTLNTLRAVRNACALDELRATIISELSEVSRQCREKDLDDASPFAKVDLPTLPPIPSRYVRESGQWSELG